MDALRRLLRAREPEPQPLDDPPFRVDPREDRVHGRRIVNEVYARTPRGTVWHRVHARQDLGLPVGAEEGRGLVFACGLFTHERPLYAARDGGHVREPLVLRLDAPGLHEICRPCREEDSARARSGRR